MAFMDEPRPPLVSSSRHPIPRRAANERTPTSPARSMAMRWPWVIGIAVVALAIALVLIANRFVPFVLDYVLSFLPPVE